MGHLWAKMAPKYVLLLVLLVHLSDAAQHRPGIKSRDAGSTGLKYGSPTGAHCCNAAGVTSTNGLCAGTCYCKPNVEGIKCDECKEGTYSLDQANTDGCSKCYCFGATNVCKPSNYTISKVRSMDGWLITDLEGRKVIEPVMDPRDNHLIAANDEMHGADNYYWDAPQAYLKNKLYSYGGNMRFVLSYIVARGDTSGVFTNEPDIILQGGPKNLRIGYLWKNNQKHKDGTKDVIEVPLREQQWFIIPPSGDSSDAKPVSREDFTLVINDMKRILVRAKFHTDQIEGGLHSVDLDLGMDEPGSKLMTGLEQCECPVGYSGLSCESCAPGYRRVNNTLVNGLCVKCDCNNHSPSCDPYTGACSVCLHHTTGVRCEKCQFGYYGNPTHGTPYDCKPCACPLLHPDNNFSPTCQLMTNPLQAGFTPGGHECTACERGYTGTRCDRCSDGYFGNPNVLGGRCIPCDCGPGTNTSIPGWCDHRTGHCLKCRGTVGQDCKRCPPRQILTNVGCAPCDDPCIDLILDDLDDMNADLMNNNITSTHGLVRKHLQWYQDRVNRTMYSLLQYQMRMQTGLRMVNQVTMNFDLEATADILYLRGKHIYERGLVLTQQGIRLTIDTEEVLDHIQDLIDQLHRIIDSLRKYGHEVSGSVLTTDRMVEQGEHILAQLRNRNFLPALDSCEREVRRVNQLRDRVNSLTSSPAHTSLVKERMAHLKSILTGVMHIVDDKVKSPVEQAFHLMQESQPVMETVKQMVVHATNVMHGAEDKLANGIKLVEASKTDLIDAAVEVSLVPRLVDDVNNLTQALEERRSILARLNGPYERRYLHPCVSHVDSMERRVHQLILIFNASREMSAHPMQAATVYQKIIQTLHQSETAAKRALEASNRAYITAYPPPPQETLVEKAQLAKIESYRLLTLARNLGLKIVPELERELVRRKVFMNQTREQIFDGNRNLELINESLHFLPTDLGRMTKDADTQLRHHISLMDQDEERINRIQESLKSDMMPRVDGMRAATASGLENISRIIDHVNGEMRIAHRYAGNALQSLDRIREMERNLGLNLTELRHKIILARQKASSIKVSLGTDGNSCVRSFRPTVTPSTTNTIILNYAIKDDARDALLFFISSATKNHFMAVEMVDRKIRFLWNAGAGTSIITHDLVIETIDPHMMKDNQWYTIAVTRIGNVATLKVTRTPQADEPDEMQIIGSSPPNALRMDLDSSAYLFVGGLPDKFSTPRELRSKKFHGCIYEASMDGNRIGLWNFYTNIGCRGCREGASAPRDHSTFTFSGDSSYAILPMIPRPPRHKLVFFQQFKTFDSNALIFFSGNERTGDSVSISLKGGHVVFQFKMGITSQGLEIRSERRYNTGQWVKIAAQREDLIGSLSVGEEMIERRMATSQSSGPSYGLPSYNSVVPFDLAQAPIYFGGVPVNFSVKSWPEVTFDPFRGCMQDMQMDTIILGFGTADSYGVENGCRKKEETSFLGRGQAPPRSLSMAGSSGRGSYLEIKSLPLKEEADISFTFRTRQANALLLLSTFEGSPYPSIGLGQGVKETHFYSVCLAGGLMEVRINGGNGESTIISDVSLNDNSYHTVSISKRNRRVHITVDDVDMGSVIKLARGTKDIEAPVTGGLYLGGIPSRVSLKGMATTKESLKGVMRHLVFNKKVISFSDPVSFEGVSIGRDFDYHLIDYSPNPNRDAPHDRVNSIV